MHAEMSPSLNAAGPSALIMRPAVDLSTLTYRSRSVLPMSELELQRLLRAAQMRNHAEGVTGMMVYDRGWIFQQLEGPAPGMARIWDSVQRDGRHTEIEVLGNAATRQRRFAEWDLKLSIHGAGAGEMQGGAFDAPSELIGRLCRGEQTAHQLPAWEQLLTPDVDNAPAAKVRARLLSLIDTVLVPKLIAALPLVSATLPLPYPQATALTRLLIAADPAAAFALVGAMHEAGGSLPVLATRLLEPAARGLGTLWQADDCSEVEVTLGLMRLQGFIRRLHLDVASAAPVASLHAPVVLVVPQPGEQHLLGATLDAELLWRAGWNPQVDFPTTSGALDALVASTWVDALDVSLSTAFRREQRLPQLSETIAHARLASLNPGLVVVVSGRVFTEPGEATAVALAGSEVGADASFGSAAQAESMILRALKRARMAAASRR